MEVYNLGEDETTTCLSLSQHYDVAYVNILVCVPI